MTKWANLSRTKSQQPSSFQLRAPGFNTVHAVKHHRNCASTFIRFHAFLTRTMLTHLHYILWSSYLRHPNAAVGDFGQSCLKALCVEQAATQT